MELQQGSIIWAVVSDQAGRNPKCRPAVVVTPTDEISKSDTFVVVAAASTFRGPLPENRVDLPWHRGKHPVTGLYKRCFALCDWIEEITHDQVESVGGIVPPRTLRKILDRIPPVI